jgi:hypothetical protein
MLQIGHRDSHDVYFFLSDPQLLPFLDPHKHDFQFEIRPADYEGDGASFQKIAFKDVGEIDFIVSRAMTPSPNDTGCHRRRANAARDDSRNHCQEDLLPRAQH